MMGVGGGTADPKTLVTPPSLYRILLTSLPAAYVKLHQHIAVLVDGSLLFM